MGRIWGSIVHQIFPIARNFPGNPGLARMLERQGTTGRTGASGTLGLTTAPGSANAVLVIRLPPGSGHTIYDTFDDEKRVI